MDASIHSIAAGLDTVWVVLCAGLVFLMEGGFAALEAGFVRSKNALNIIMKVFMDCTVGMLGYFMLGFALMYGVDWNSLSGTSGFFIKGEWDHLGLQIPVYAFWLFQAGFAIAVPTIISGAVAERMKFAPYIVVSFLVAAFIYPVAGHWIWGASGWLNKMGMLDFAGSAAIHSLGGWASLAAVIVLGPRTGKYNKDGSANVMPGHNLPLAALGAFLLWFGWFGFNPGSTLSGLDLNIARIALNTNLAAAAGGTLAGLYTLRRFGKADPSMAINGALGGLVAITAGCAYVEPISSLLIGACAGVLVVEAVPLLDDLKADDPVGAIAVHGVCGTFGTLMVGLFAENGGLFYGGGWHLLGVQSIGIIALSAWGFAASYLLFKALQLSVGIRVSEEEEMDGLDISEHGMTAYNDLEFNPFKSLPHSVAHVERQITAEEELA